MAWHAAHPDNTMEVRVPDEDGAPTFTVGFWPPSVSERLNMTMAALRHAKNVDELVDPTTQEFLKTLEANHGAVVGMVRWGVRGWTGGGLEPAVLEVEEVDGVKHKKLSDASVNLLCVNKLHGRLADKAWLFNILTPEQKKTSGLLWPWEVSPNATGAESATPPGETTSRREG